MEISTLTIIFSARKYSRYMKKGPVELRADEEDGESESKVTSQIFGCLQRPKKEVRYLKNIFFQTLEAFFPHKGVFVTKVMKANIIAFIKTKILRPVTSMTTPPFTFFEFYTPLN